jgi:hypothetical protein
MHTNSFQSPTNARPFTPLSSNRILHYLPKPVRSSRLNSSPGPALGACFIYLEYCSMQMDKAHHKAMQAYSQALEEETRYRMEREER